MKIDDEILRQMLENNKDGSGKFTRRMAINIARFFDIEPMDMVSELEKRGIIKQGSRRWFELNGGITKKHIEQAKQGKML